MTGIRRAFELVRGFWFGPTPIEPLVLCRIGIGLVMLHAWAVYGLDLERVWGPDGMSYYASGRELELVHQLPWVVWTILMVSAVCLICGLGTPAAALCLAGCQWLFMEPSRYFTWSWAKHIPVVLLWLSVSGCGRAYSLDSVIRRRVDPRWQPASEVESVGLRLIQIQITLIYLRAAWGRVDSAGWINGEMMWGAMVNPLFARFNGLELLPLRPLLMVMCWIGLLIELAAPILLWIRKTRPVMVLLCIAFHLALHVTTGVHWWQLFMFAALTVFLSPTLARRVLAPLRRTRLRRTTD